VQHHTVAKLIDRMHKMPHEAFVAESDAIFTPSQRDSGASNKLLGLLKTKDIGHLPEKVRQHSAALELKELLARLHGAGISNALFDLTIMRGFDYYTDVVFEVFDENPENNRSMMGGGRYDGLVGLFGVEPVPTVGFGFGDVTFQNFLEGHKLLPPERSDTDVCAVIIGDSYAAAQKVIGELREMGLNVAVDCTGRKLDKQIQTAVKKNIHYAIFIGEKELKEEQFELKNLMTGASERRSLARIVSIVKDYRGEGED